MILKMIIEMIAGFIIDKLVETTFISVIEPRIIKPLEPCKIGTVFAGAIY